MGEPARSVHTHGDWWFIALTCVLLIVEILADKVPALDHVNDVVQTFVRPAAGGLVAVAASGDGKIEPWLLLVAGVLIAGGVHAVKASARPLINVATGGAGAPVVSTIEDVSATGVSVLALVAPIVAAVAVVGAVIASGWWLNGWQRRRAGQRDSA